MPSTRGGLHGREERKVRGKKGNITPEEAASCQTERGRPGEKRARSQNSPPIRLLRSHPPRRNAHDAFTRPSPPPVTCDRSQLFAGISVGIWARIPLDRSVTPWRTSASVGKSSRYPSAKKRGESARSSGYLASVIHDSYWD